MWNKRALFLSALGICLLVGCSSPETPKATVNDARIKDVKERINKHVKDADRATAMHAIVNELRAGLENYQISINAKRNALIQANRNYATTRQELEEIYDSMNGEIVEMMTYAQDAHFRLKQLATETEWNGVAGGRKKLFGFQ